MYLTPSLRAKSTAEITAICREQCKAGCCRGNAFLAFGKGEEEQFRTLAKELTDVDIVVNEQFIAWKDQPEGRCPFLQEDHTCAIYMPDRRPQACRNHPAAPHTAGCRLAGWQPKPRVFLATVHGKQVPYEFVAERGRLVNELIGEGVYGGDTTASSVRVDHNRNLCVEAFLKSNAEYLLFIDDDMLFPPGMVARMLQHDKDIVCGVYFQRNADGAYPHVYRFNRDGQGDYGQEGHLFAAMIDEAYRAYKHMPFHDGPAMILRDDLVIPIDAGGTGCVLIKRKVLAEMSAPWFRTEGATNGDMQWFYKAKQQHAFEVWADLGIICAHQTSSYIGIGRFLKSMDAPGVLNNSTPAVVNSKEYWEQLHRSEYGTIRSYSGFDEIVSYLTSLFGRRVTVVDFGCGRASVHDAMHSHCDCHIIGVDFAETAQEDNQRRWPNDDWLVADVRTTGLAADSADVAISNSVIEHLADPKAMVDEMWRVVKPGGLILIGIPLNLPHKEHVMVYDYDSVVALGRQYSSLVNLYPLEGRTVLALEKPSEAQARQGAA